MIYWSREKPASNFFAFNEKNFKKVLTFPLYGCILIDRKGKEIPNTRKDRKMKVLVQYYDLVKYDEKSVESWEHIYEIEGFEVKTISEKEICEHTDGSCVDEYNEYLILHFANGEIGTFRNSHVDMFRIH